MSKSDLGRALLKWISSGAIFFALSGCATGLEVRSDVDPGADFSKFRNWSFFEPMGIEGGYNSPVYGEHFREAISAEMSERGYQQSNNPDLRVNVTIRVDDKVTMRSYTTPYMSGNYYRHGGGYYGTGVGVGVGVGSRPTKTTEASVFIDLVDVSTNQIAWQGVAVIDASDKVAQRLRDAIYTAVNRVYDEYPYRAGSG